MTKISRAVPSLIAKKRDGGELESGEVRWLVEAFSRGDVPDYQMSAFAMAALLRGMSRAEALAMTLAIRDSGRTIKLRTARPIVDKHSTGGVGDKVSICLAPAAAAAGLCVPMICGRGLGHTGGTVDKLETIAGFDTSLPMDEFEHLVERIGCALIGQTDDLAPADRKLYALRDVTATVESVPLITASILGKKLCANLDALVLDVKVGRGAFMTSLHEARELARSLVDVGAAAGLRATAVLTSMDQPLGWAVGNALEAAEAFQVLCGAGPSDVLECTLALGSQMLLAGGLERSVSAAERKLLSAIRSGAAAAKMEEVIAAQHGDPRVVREPDRLPKAAVVLAVRAQATGFVRELDARKVAEVALLLGAGRARLGDPIEPSVGVVLRKKTGDAVQPGDILGELHGRNAGELEPAADMFCSAYAIGNVAPTNLPLVIEICGTTG